MWRAQKALHSSDRHIVLAATRSSGIQRSSPDRAAVHNGDHSPSLMFFIDLWCQPPYPDIRVSIVDLTEIHQSQISSYSRKLRPDYLVVSRLANSSCYPCIDYRSHDSFYQIAISKCCAAAVHQRPFISRNHVLSACLIPHSAESSRAPSQGPFLLRPNYSSHRVHLSISNPVCLLPPAHHQTSTQPQHNTPVPCLPQLPSQSHNISPHHLKSQP